MDKKKIHLSLLEKTIPREIQNEHEMALSPGPYFQYPGTWLPIHQQGKPGGVCQIESFKDDCKNLSCLKFLSAMQT